MTDIIDRLLDASDGWTGDAVCVDADVAREGAKEIARLRGKLTDIHAMAQDYSVPFEHSLQNIAATAARTLHPQQRASE
jgi:hypothetical protein